VSSPSSSEIARFKHEFNQLKQLDHEGIVKTYDLIEANGRFGLVVEDFDSITVKALIKKQNTLPIKLFLELAIQVSTALAIIHQQDVIHRNIKPDALFIDTDTNQIKIANFGIATDFTRGNASFYTQDIIEDTLPYMSPEQTGRMNRSVDYRTDMYSLGISFYEMLTGVVPFSSDDPLSILHAHIAAKAVPPCKHSAEIPNIISDIVMKLLEKNTDDRYQTCFGLLADINECRRQFSENDTIIPFKLGGNDHKKAFIIPQKLFGRDIEIQQLVSVFDELIAPTSPTSEHFGAGVIFVSGEPGIGKTSIINEIQKSITGRRGYFISGKYEKFSQDQPFSSIIHALQEWVQQILSENNENIQSWKKTLLLSLGPNGNVIIDIIPQLELIIGPQPNLAILDSVEARNRFKYVFENFIAAIPSKQHPLVLFLDDLQWADTSSLQLLKIIATSPYMNYLYIIGSYRDEEVGHTHPLTDAIIKIEMAGKQVHRITLSPLLASDIKDLIEDFLDCSAQASIALADLVHKKTNGNPFFVIQFLETLYNEMLITLNPEHGWEWDIDKIVQHKVTDNVVDLLAVNMRRLPDTVEEVIKAAAAIGLFFDLETLAYILRRAVDEVLYDLTSAISEGFILFSTDTGNYKFNHDRIQEVAYSLLPDKQKSVLHYLIAKRALESESKKTIQGMKLFYIVDQLHLGSAQIKSSGEREQLVQLSMQAGKKAKASSSFTEATQYFQICTDFLNEDSWQTQYEFTLALYSELIESINLSGDFQKMEALAEVALTQAKSTLDKVGIISSRIKACISQEDFEGAIQIATDTARLLGINFVRNPSEFRILLMLIRTKFALRGRKPESFLKYHIATDQEYIAALRIIGSAVGGMTFIDRNMVAQTLLICIRLSVKYGITPDHAFWFTAYGAIHSSGLWDFESAKQYGEIGYKIAEQFNARNQKSRILFAINAVIKHWGRPLKETLEPLEEAYQIGVDTGDFIFAATSLLTLDDHSISTCVELTELETQFNNHHQTILDLNQTHIAVLHSIAWQYVQNLTGNCENPLFLTGNAIHAENKIDSWTASNNQVALVTFAYYRTRLRYMLNEYTIAMNDGYSFRKQMKSILGFEYTRECIYLNSAIKLMLYRESSFFRRGVFRIGVLINQLILRRWSRHTPANCLHMYHLVKALYAWQIKRNNDKAKKEFERALSLCKKPEDLAIKAFTLEHMAQFNFSIGYGKTAKKLISSAYRAYARWGAVVKLEQLERNYPDVFSK